MTRINSKNQNFCQDKWRQRTYIDIDWSWNRYIIKVALEESEVDHWHDQWVQQMWKRIVRTLSKLSDEYWKHQSWENERVVGSLFKHLGE